MSKHKIFTTPIVHDEFTGIRIHAECLHDAVGARQILRVSSRRSREKVCHKALIFMSIKKVTSHPTQNEALIFERSQTGRIGYRSAKAGCRGNQYRADSSGYLRRDDDLDGVPEVSEVDVVRHFTRMSTWNYSIDLGYVSARLVHDEVQLAAQRKGRTDRRALPGLHPLAPGRRISGCVLN